jgi:hypothetical protein
VAGPEEAAATTAGSKGFLAAINGTGAAIVFNTKYIGNTTTITKENAVTTDSAGNIYTAGNTNDSTLTLVKPLLKHYQAGGMDALIIAAYSPAGTPTLLSYWGGSGYDIATGVGVYTSTSGPTTTTNLFIAGYTSGGTFPILNAVQGTYGGGAWDGFVAMFTSANGGHFTEGYSTFLGGSGADFIYALGVGTSGNARVAGMTDSAGVATTGAYQTILGGGYDAFLAEIQTTP